MDSQASTRARRRARIRGISVVTGIARVVNRWAVRYLVISKAKVKNRARVRNNATNQKQDPKSGQGQAGSAARETHRKNAAERPVST